LWQQVAARAIADPYLAGYVRRPLPVLRPVSCVRLNEIVNGRPGVTPSTALRLAKALGTSAQFWINGQLALDLYRASHDKEELRQLERIEPVSH